MPIDPSKIPPWMQQLNGMQLTPEQIAQLSNQFAGTYGNVTRDGFDFAPAVNSGGYGAEGAGDGNSGQVMGFSAVPTGTGWNLKDGEDFYGGFDKSGKFEGARQPHAFDMGDATPFLFALAAGAAAMAPGAMGAAAGTGSSAAGPGMAGWGTDLGVSSAAGMGGGGTAAGAGGLGAAAGGGGGAMSTMPALEMASFPSTGLPGAMSTAGGSAGGLGGLLSGLGGGGGSGLLGLGASALGALSGAQGQESEQTTARDIPEWLKPHVMKNLNYAGGLLDKQMAPGAMPGWEQMRNTGMGLLSAPQAGNGFSKFFPGR